MINFSNTSTRQTKWNKLVNLPIKEMEYQEVITLNKVKKWMESIRWQLNWKGIYFNLISVLKIIDNLWTKCINKSAIIRESNKCLSISPKTACFKLIKTSLKISKLLNYSVYLLSTRQSFPFWLNFLASKVLGKNKTFLKQPNKKALILGKKSNTKLIISA